MMIDVLGVVLALLTLVAIGLAVHNWRLYRLLSQQEKALLEMVEQWEAQKQADILALKTYRNNGSVWWAINEREKADSEYLLGIWRN